MRSSTGTPQRSSRLRCWRGESGSLTSAAGVAELGDARAQGLDRAGAEEGGRVRLAQGHGGALDHGGAQGARQLLELVELDLRLLAPRAALERARDEDARHGGRLHRARSRRLCVVPCAPSLLHSHSQAVRCSNADASEHSAIADCSSGDRGPPASARSRARWTGRDGRGSPRTKTPPWPCSPSTPRATQRWRPRPACRLHLATTRSSSDLPAPPRWTSESRTSPLPPRASASARLTRGA